MHKYVEQLAEDIHKAAKKTISPDLSRSNAISDLEELQKHFEHVEQYLNGPFYKLSEIVGIDAAMLPDDALLTDDQTALLATEMEQMLNTWNFYPDFPQDNGKEVPPRLRYRAMRSSWECEQTIVDSGEIHLEFCRYDEEECPFPGYCNGCREHKMAGDVDADSDFDDEGFIASIFNYCDRWCERCDFTTKCRSFAMEKEFFEEMEDRKKSTDEKIQDLEDRIGGSFPGSSPGNSDSELPFDLDDEEDYEGFFSPEKKIGKASGCSINPRIFQQGSSLPKIRNYHL